MPPDVRREVERFHGYMLTHPERWTVRSAGSYRSYVAQGPEPGPAGRVLMVAVQMTPQDRLLRQHLDVERGIGGRRRARPLERLQQESRIFSKASAGREGS